MFESKKQVSETIVKRLRNPKRQCKNTLQNQTKINLKDTNKSLQKAERCSNSEQEMKKVMKCDANESSSMHRYTFTKIRSELENSSLAKPTKLKIKLKRFDNNDPIVMAKMFNNRKDETQKELEFSESAEDQGNIIKSDFKNISVSDEETTRDVITIPQSIRYLAFQQREILVALTIGPHQVLAKIDSGTSYSCMSQELADTLRDNVKINFHPQILSLANGNIHKVQEELSTELKIGEKTIELRALILPDATNDLILGTDFLTATETTLICGGKQIKLKQSKYPVYSEKVPSQEVPAESSERKKSVNSEILRKKKKIKATEEEREYQRIYRETNKETQREYQRKYREKCNKKMKVSGLIKKMDMDNYQKKYRESNKEKIRKYRERYKQTNNSAGILEK